MQHVIRIRKQIIPEECDVKTGVLSHVMTIIIIIIIILYIQRIVHRDIFL